MKKDFSQNLYLLPLVLCIMQLCFLFVALFNSGYFFANKVLIVSCTTVFLWLLLCINETKRQRLGFDIKSCILIALFIIVALFCIKIAWFSHYLSVGAIDNFFKGETFIDVLYHSTLAQSIVTNGYPSALQNAPIFVFYHSLSHYIISIISNLLSLPCFIVYNYIFPVFAVPLFLYLLQKNVIIVKCLLNKTSQLNIVDYFLLAGLICSFTSLRFINRIGLTNYSYLLSESCLLSIILLLWYICIVEWGYRQYKYFGVLNYVFLIPLFILGLSFAKISTGCIFCAGVCYYIFRKNKIISLYSLFIFIYILIFAGYYFISNKYISTYPATNNSGSFALFHYVKNYTKNPIYSIFHYIFFFFPVILLYSFNKTKAEGLFCWNKPCSEKLVLFLELAIILSLIGSLPGLFMRIEGGSALYFYIPVNFIVWIIFIGTDTIGSFGKWLGAKMHNGEINFYKGKTIVYKINLLIFLIVFLATPLFIGREIRLYSMMKTTVATRIDPTHFRKEFKNKIFNLFLPAKTISDKNYLMFNDINLKTQNNRQDYCVYISGNSLINRYDYYTRERKDKRKFLYGNLAVSAYLGFPIINSIYVKDNIFYRGDMLKLGKYDEIVGYSLPPIICNNRVTEENMMKTASKIGKKKIIILENNSYKILDVQ